MANSTVAQDTSVLILFDDNSPFAQDHREFAERLANHLYGKRTQRISATILGYSQIAASTEYHWLILIYTPQAIRTLGDFVSTAMRLTIARQRRGVLLITTGQETPPPEWSVIRQYDGNDPQIYDNISRALQYTKAPYQEAKQAQGVFPQMRLGGQSTSPSTGKIAIISLICALIIIGGVSGIILLPKAFQSAGTAQVTATATKPATHNPTITTTSTPHSTPAPTIDTNTQKARQTALAQVTAQPPTIKSFDPAQWSTSVTTQTTSCVLGNNSYQVSISQPSLYTPCLTALSKGLKNFAYQISMKITGDAGGVIFRADDKGNYYRFSVLNGTDPKQISYSAFLCGGNASCIGNAVNQGTSLSQVQGSMSIDPTKPITLTVLARDSNIDLYINDTYVARVTDNAIHAGQIGVYAALRGPDATTATTTNATFSDIKVWSLDK